MYRIVKAPEDLASILQLDHSSTLVHGPGYYMRPATLGLFSNGLLVSSLQSPPSRYMRLRCSLWNSRAIFPQGWSLALVEHMGLGWEVSPHTTTIVISTKSPILSFCWKVLINWWFTLTLGSLRLSLLDETARESISDLLVETRSATVEPGGSSCTTICKQPGSSVSTNFFRRLSFLKKLEVEFTLCYSFKGH